MKRGILIVGTYPPPFGGVPRHIEYLVPLLVERGWDVHVLSPGRTGTTRGPGYTIHKPPRVKKALVLARSRLEMGRGALGVLPSLRRDSLRAWLEYMAMTAVGARSVREHDIRVVTAYNLIYGCPVGALLARRFGIPLVVNNLGEAYSNPGFFARHPEVLDLVVSTGVRFLAPSRHCARSWERLGPSPEVEVVHHGIDVKTFHPSVSGERVRAELGLDPGDRVVLFVGRMVADMGLHTVLRAIPALAELHPCARFVVAGAPGALTAEARRLEAALPGRVFVRENVPLDVLPAFYAAADVVAAPTLGDRACGSLAAAEAMATGKPVVATRVGGVPEFVRDGETGILVAPDDPAACGAALAALLGDPELARRMGEAGRRRVEALWDRDRTNARYEEIFRGLAGRRVEPSPVVR